MKPIRLALLVAVFPLLLGQTEPAATPSTVAPPRSLYARPNLLALNQPTVVEFPYDPSVTVLVRTRGFVRLVDADGTHKQRLMAQSDETGTVRVTLVATEGGDQAFVYLVLGVDTKVFGIYRAESVPTPVPLTDEQRARMRETYDRLVAEQQRRINRTPPPSSQTPLPTSMPATPTPAQ